MTRYVALLRAVNVGGITLLMSDLAALCRAAGFARVETYIASGNVVFDSRGSPAGVKSELEKRLYAHARKPVGVLLRDGEEMQAVLNANPFPNADPKFAYVIFLDDSPPLDALAQVTGRQVEQLKLGTREIFVHYPSGMGRSKLRIPAAKTGTARNMNTVAKLAEMAAKR